MAGPTLLLPEAAAPIWFGLELKYILEGLRLEFGFDVPGWLKACPGYAAPLVGGKPPGAPLILGLCELCTDNLFLLAFS